ncbi:hypothetical protein RQN30_08375 [Arcanobacterium hippocoleae]
MYSRSWLGFIKLPIAVFIALAMAAGIIASAPAAVAGSWTYTSTHEWSSETYVFPPIEQSFPLQLGDFQQSQQLAVKSISKNNGGAGGDSADKCGITITWEYTANVTDGKAVGTLGLGKVTDVQRYFTTTQESGLGQPTITEIKKDGQKISNGEINGAGVNSDHIYSVKDKRSGAEQLKPGKYVYTITTPVAAPRQQYVLNVLTQVTGSYPPGTVLSISGKPQIVTKKQQITVPSAFAYPLDMNSHETLWECAGDTPQVKSFAGDGVNIAGSYDQHDSTKIQWSYSYVNSSGEPKGHTIALNLDRSHQLTGKSTVYYYKPGENGYELASQNAVEGTTISVPGLQPGWMVQLVADTKVSDEYSSHTLSQAALAAKKQIWKSGKSGMTAFRKLKRSIRILISAIPQLLPGTGLRMLQLMGTAS